MIFFYFQWLAAIKQSLNAQNVSFFMRGGKWVHVALGSSDSGKLPLPLPPLLSPVSSPLLSLWTITVVKFSPEKIFF